MNLDAIMEERPLSEAEKAEFERRRRGRNIALLLALFAWIVVIYVVTLVRLGG